MGRIDKDMDEAIETSRRRTDQMRQRRRTRNRIALGLFALTIVLAIAVGPSIVCNSPIADSLLGSNAAKYGWQAKAYGIRLGWLTPLRLDDLELTGPSGQTRLTASRIETEITLIDLISGRNDFGTVQATGLRSEVAVDSGTSSLESDLAALNAADDSEPSATSDASADSGDAMSIKIVVRDAEAMLTSAPTGEQWKLAGIAADLTLVGDLPQGNVSLTLIDPRSQTGKLELRLAAPAQGGAGALQLDASLAALPLSIAKLLAMRFPTDDGLAPQYVAGLADGDVRLTIDASGALRGDFRSLNLRDVQVGDPRLSEQLWAIQAARVEGSFLYTETHLQGMGLRVSSDVGVADLNGTFRIAAENVAGDLAENPFAWLEALSGTAGLEVDLARLTKAAPGLLPLRENASIESAILRGSLSGIQDASGFLTNIDLESDPIRATSFGRPLQIEPMTIQLAARPSGAWIMAERLQIRSMFANATGSGDLRNGQAEFNVDLGRLATMLSPLVDMSETELGGSTSGNIRWTAQPDGLWRLDGQATAAKLAIGLSGGETIREPAVDLKVGAIGIWGGDHLSRLNEAAITLRNASQMWDLELERPIDQPTSQTLLPIKAVGNGRVGAVVSLLRPWLPAEMGAAEGEFQATLNADIAMTDGVLRAATMVLEQPAVVWSGARYSQSTLQLNFDGKLPMAMDEIAIRSFTAIGNAAALSAQGDYRASGQSDLEIAWRADIERLRQSTDAIAAQFQPIQLTNFVPQPAVESSDYQYKGSVEGRATLRGIDGIWKANVEADGENLELLQNVGVAGQVNFANGAQPIPVQTTTESLWREPNMKLIGTVQYIESSGDVDAEDLKVTTQWLDATLAAKYRSDATDTQISVSGPARIRSDEIARRLEELIGQPIQMSGSSEGPIDLQVRMHGDDPVDVVASGTLAWETATIAGVEIGAASIPLKTAAGQIEIAPTTIQLPKGRLNLAGKASYVDDPMWIQATPGLIAEGLELETEMTRTWLKYVAPLLADATDVNGTFKLEIDHAMIYPLAPAQNKISGRLGIDHAQVGPGPIANSVVGVIGQFASLGGSKPLTAGNRWIELPAQSVDFVMENGVVTHQRLMMQLDDVQVVSSGSASLDGRLELNAQIPIEEAWAGTDMKKAGMIGQTFQIPIDGTFNRPSLDSRGVQESLTRLGTKALEETAKNALQKELSRGLQKLFGNR
ncbi:hypothetical protein Poly24_28630 [Rosistilla carotiformis]|uniref:Uncharacterized protein n=1 Tax=Rosistilla carotiformis TaxID=2528017 RepID=A0A518JUC3_9BACT|nr:hypothetical protein [Rosistilla carotiformis]QDV69148.1 hypothetical protein Poly24_28630 [Rosistilla carotiformis]